MAHCLFINPQEICLSHFQLNFQMAEADQGERLKKAIESLFKVTDIFSSGGDANLQVEMKENQMAFGILLQTCGLMKGGNETKMRDIRKSLDESSVVRF